ncbi:MAG: BatD family protein [Alloprevotella sp.]|nr:BatD family protein [Alloprevotella sp.]
MKFHTLTTLLLIALLTTPSFPQVIKVEVPSSIPQGEYFHLKFILPSSKATGFTPPSLSSFTILAGPSVSKATSVQMTNGKISSSGTTTYTYVLSPKDPGTFHIGEASASVSGKQIHSKPQTIRVTKGPSGNAPRPSAMHQSPQPDEEIQTIGAPITQRDLSITLTPSRTKV